MANFQPNNESRIEILRQRMDDLVDRKNQQVKKLGQKISDAEEKIQVIRNELKALESFVEQWREKREIIETACFREILKIHREIMEITRMHH